MGEALTSINGKAVFLRSPIVAPGVDIVGRSQEMNKIMAAWMSGADGLPLSPMLVGAPGVGKNRIIYACSRMRACPLYIFQGHEDITAEDLICSVRISDNKARKMDYILSPLVSAMITGGICFIDEIGKIRPRALAPLSSLLDERRYLDSTLLGERVQAHPGFRLVAATNRADLDQSRLPDYIQSRLRPVITIDYPDRREIDTMIKNQVFTKQDQGRSDLFDCFWTLWKEHCPGRPPTPRDSLQIFSYAVRLANFDKARSTPGATKEGKTGCGCLTEGYLWQAFDTFHESISGGDT